LASFDNTVLNFLLGNSKGCTELQKAAKQKNPKFIQAYAKENHVIYALGLGLQKNNCLLPNLQKSFAVEKKLESDRIALAKQAMDAFEKAGCKVILMKSIPDFPYTDNDLDFVSFDGFDKARKALENQGFSMAESRSYLREPLKRFFEKPGNTCSVHLHKAFSWNGIKYLDTAKVWNKKAIKNIGNTAFFVPGPSHDYMITAAHAIFENKCIYLSDFINLLHLAGKLNWEHALLSFKSQVQSLNTEQTSFPFMLNATFSSSFKKLIMDLAKLRLSQLPRQAFSYSIVDYLLYKRALRKKNALEAL